MEQDKKVVDKEMVGKGIDKVHDGMVGAQEGDFDQEEEVTDKIVYYCGEQMVT